MLDYYFIHGRPAGILVEEFVRHKDFSAAGRHGAHWFPGSGWVSDAAFGRAVRTDPDLRARVVPSTRIATLPDEAVLRTYFRDYDEFPVAAPLRFSEPQPPPGFREKRLYRVLFAKDPIMPGPAGRLPEGDDICIWELRRIAHGVAWCLDVTALLSDDGAKTLGRALERLTDLMRLEQGLIPVTTERLQ